MTGFFISVRGFELEEAVHERALHDRRIEQRPRLDGPVRAARLRVRERRVSSSACSLVITTASSRVPRRSAPSASAGKNVSAPMITMTPSSRPDEQRLVGRKRSGGQRHGALLRQGSGQRERGEQRDEPDDQHQEPAGDRVERPARREAGERRPVVVPLREEGVEDLAEAVRAQCSVARSVPGGDHDRDRRESERPRGTAPGRRSPRASPLGRRSSSPGTRASARPSARR